MHRHRYNGSSLGGDETMGKSDLIEDETSLAYRLSNLRKDHDLSQKQLADQLHVTHSQISRIESGETKNPNISIVIDAARFFHVSTDYLLNRLSKNTVDQDEEELLRVYRSMEKEYRQIYIEQGKAFLK